VIYRIRVSTPCQDVSAFLVVSGGALFSSIVDLLVVLGFQNLDDVVEIEVIEGEKGSNS
jgi:hypothetical protein